MKNIVFMGAYDKTDMLIYVAKILTMLNKKVILIDTTILKKSRYVVPTMCEDKKCYITSYEDIDVAIGFENFEAIKQYQMENFGKEEGYDFALYDIDRIIAYKSFNLSSEDLHYFVTSFDTFCVKRGIQILSALSHDTNITKIYYTKNMLEKEDEYLNYLTQGKRIKWNKKNIVFFPFETEDLDAIYTNQRTGVISMKGVSSTYYESILYLVEEISKESAGQIRKVGKSLMS